MRCGPAYRTVALGALGVALAACGAPRATAPTATTTETVEADAAPATTEAAADASVEEAPEPGTGIQCGELRCTAERPHCCKPMGDILDTNEPMPEPFCVADHMHCRGLSFTCKGAADCPAGEHCIHDAAAGSTYCDSDLEGALIVCREDSECAVRCDVTDGSCRDGGCHCP